MTHHHPGNSQDFRKLPGVPELAGILSAVADAEPDQVLVIRCGDLALPAVRSIAKDVSRRTRRSIQVDLRDGEESANGWTLFCGGERWSAGSVQPFGDEGQPE